MDGIESINANRFQKTLKAICLKLRNENIAYRWRACLESEKTKGLHFHVFLLVNACNKNSCAIINTKNDGWLKTYLENHAMTMYLSQPKADIHRVGGSVGGKRQNYATLAGDKLNDCLEWVSYLVKKRSKPDHIKNIYFSSRDSKTSAKHLKQYQKTHFTKTTQGIEP